MYTYAEFTEKYPALGDYLGTHFVTDPTPQKRYDARYQEAETVLANATEDQKNALHKNLGKTEGDGVAQAVAESGLGITEVWAVDRGAWLAVSHY